MHDPSPPSPRKPSRPVLTSDLMLMVLAVALGMTLAKFWKAELDSELSMFTSVGWSTANRTRLAGYAMAGLLPATFAALALRLRPPRPRMWLVAREPGPAACFAAAVGLLVEMAFTPMHLRTMGGPTSPMLVSAWYWPSAPTAAVASAWLALAVGRRWRSRGDWVDRLGMFVGLCWLLLPAALALAEFQL